jgi:hypothetical protein
MTKQYSKKAKNKILAVGCSFMLPDEKAPQTIIPQCQLVANAFNAQLDNRSIGGNGNSHILYHCLEALEQESYDLVLIGWSSPFRWDFTTTNHNKWFSIKMNEHVHDLCNKRVDPDFTAFVHWSTKVLLLANLLRNKGTQFVMWNSLDCWSDGNTVLHKKLLAMPEFVDVTSSQFADCTTKKQTISDTNLHPNQESQNHWADKILFQYGKIV